MSSNNNYEATKKKLENMEKRRKEETNRAKRENKKINELDTILNRYDPNNKLNRDKFKSNFYVFLNTQKKSSSLINSVDQFLNKLKLDEFEELLRDKLDSEIKDTIKKRLGNSNYISRGYIGFRIQNSKKNEGKLKRFNIYFDFLQGKLQIISKEQKKIREKIKNLEKYIQGNYAKLGKLDDKKKKELLQKLIELGVLKNIRDEKNNSIDSDKRIMIVIDQLKSCEKEILEIILRDLNNIMLMIQSNFDRIEDKVVRKKLEKIDNKVERLQNKRISNTNTTKSIQGIVLSENFQSLDRLLSDYNKKLKNIKDIIEESQRKNPFQRKLKGVEAKVYKKTDEAKKIIEKIIGVLNKAKAKTKVLYSSAPSSIYSSRSSLLSRSSR